MKKSGFTLIELVVAVFITSIVVLAAYWLMTGSTQNFKAQNDRRILESNLRNAELILQRDFSRIGYHTPFDKLGGSSRVTTCVPATTSLQYHALYVDYDTDDNVSSVNFLADLTDYDGFSVKAFSDGKITFENSMQLPLAAVDFGGDDDEPARKFVKDNGFTAVFDRAFKFAHAAYILSPDNKGILTTWDNSNTITYCSDLTEFGFSPTSPFEGDTVYPVLMVNYHVEDNNLVRCYGDPFDGTNRYEEDTCEILLRNIKMFKIHPLTESSPVADCTQTPDVDIPLQSVVGLGICLAAASETVTPDAIGSNADTIEEMLDAPFWFEDGVQGGYAFGSAYGTAMIKNRNDEWAAINSGITLNEL